MATKPAAKKPAPRKTPPSKPAATTKAAGQAAPARPRPLTLKLQRFVDEYLIDLNATQAAIRAGYSRNSASEQGYENLRKPQIQEAIALGRKQQQERTQISADRVLQEAWNIATADARELSGLIFHACRHCHGAGHLFHWRDEDEYVNACAHVQAENAQRDDDAAPMAMPTDEGGYGFNTKLHPHPDCPKCDGEGEMRLKLGDTRFLSPGAVSLFAGVKQTKFGIEVQTHSKDAALEKLFKYTGLYERDNEQKNDPFSAMLARVAAANGNGFKPIADDPERPSAAAPGASTLPIVQDVAGDDEDD